MPLKNSLHRRNHKERSQLAHRQKLGILEKHKDYVLRARDYHSKQDRLKRLAQKAAERNKDEFYFGMNRQRTEGGVHVHDRGNVALPADIIKVLKTQDENYIRTMRASSMKKIEKLRAQLGGDADMRAPGALEGLEEEELEVLREAGIIAGPSGTKKGKKRNPGHIVFAETEVEARQTAAQLKGKGRASEVEEMEIDTKTKPLSGLGWKMPNEKGKKRRTTSEEDEDNNVGSQNLSAGHRTRLLKELSARLHRDRMLRYAARELEMQRLLMNKGGSKKLEGVQKVGDVDGGDESDDSLDDRPRPAKRVDEKVYKPRVYKWRAERKK
ncbi:unnamed protein product [Peniophora sp. CBMAI 1063]|nr:unnamed protein product [Peniophora sp. CBMAI 1063]